MSENGSNWREKHLEDSPLQQPWHHNIVTKILEDGIFHKDWCGGYRIGKHPTYGWVATNTDIAGFHQVFLCEMKYCPFCGEKLE